ncbi:hypothetical protein DID96_31350 [Burkholderia sp. Bp8963]|uniref:hypothetical protein n=1 Tax=Burkholderia sp. Bp8963 TaxID=2184547 RepID=UPI000F596EE9|nr:hypothetical protein [Burkholderia sp. Bp8963]RQS62505.1 hypothetical protein DID96_31350 [Burkholderia sp. Bp8963]
MIVQRLSFRAATGKLYVGAVWQCLAKRGARICRWNVHVDRQTGVGSMTVDIVDADPLTKEDLAAMLGETPMELSVTLFHVEVIANPGASPIHVKQGVHAAADSLSISRPSPKLTLVRDITHHIAHPKRD